MKCASIISFVSSLRVTNTLLTSPAKSEKIKKTLCWFTLRNLLYKNQKTTTKLIDIKDKSLKNIMCL